MNENEEVVVLEGEAPEIQALEVEAPEIHAPEIQAPEVEAPVINGLEEISAEPDINDIVEILGVDPSSVAKFAAEINQELSNRLQHIATSGLDKETRKELLSKYMIPANCTKISAPVLNAEIKAALPESSVKRDKGIESRQKQLATAISSLSAIISAQLKSKDRNNSFLKNLMDSVKILCDI